MIAALLALLASDAHACGGFFCQSTAQPVDQAGERILFAIDEEAGRVEVQVQIAYAGTASEFAWLLPVPAEPEVTTTVDDVFQVLGQSTFPQFVLSFEQEGKCRGELGGLRGFGQDMSISDGDVGGEPAPGVGGVQVGAQGLVGPYEMVTLRGETADALVGWLQTNGYLVPDDVGARLAPYVAEHSWFVALRLQKDRTTGDLVPVAVSYPGTEPVIPLQLTAVAARPGMPLQPFVLGAARAVPDNYLHVTVNPFAIDWLAAGSNWFDVVGRAADEAGGQAFATDFAGPTVGLKGLFWAEGRFDTDALRDVDDAFEVLNALVTAGFPLSSGVLGIADGLLDRPLRNGNDLTAELGALGYLGWQAQQDLDGRTIDGEALADALEASWIPAMRHAEDLVRRLPHLTRLTSSMSADEMTADPRFVLNPDMPDVARRRDATLVTHCSPTVPLFEAPRSLRLPDGREMWIPADVATSGDMTGWLANAWGTATETIERTSRRGAATVLEDHRGDIDATLVSLQRDGGCGCAGGGAGSLAGAAAGLVALRRRRRTG